MYKHLGKFSFKFAASLLALKSFASLVLNPHACNEVGQLVEKRSMRSLIDLNT